MNINRRQFLKLGSVLSIPAIVTLSLTEEKTEELFWEDIAEKINEFMVQYRGENLSRHPALWIGQKFSYDSKLFHIQVAQEWKCTPSELSAMPYKDKVDIYAWYVVKKQMEKIEYYEESRKQERK